jgi:glutamine phosphoribosylpyrophosphate amidotransferase
MCGVLGIAIKNFNEGDYDLVRSLFIQSMIRGKHATGVSYVKNGRVNTVKDPIPANEWIKQQNLEEWKNEDGNLYCVGHVRYSTSDLRYNQPMATDLLAIAHNGVISQEAQETWIDHYELETVTANDSELVLRALEKGKNPLTYFHPASMAVCSVDSEKKLTAFRNEERPLYLCQDENIIIFDSTEDILKRSNLFFGIKKLPMYEVLTVDNFEIKSYNTVIDNVEDLQ